MTSPKTFIVMYPSGNHTPGSENSLAQIVCPKLARCLHFSITRYDPGQGPMLYSLSSLQPALLPTSISSPDM